MFDQLFQSRRTIDRHGAAPAAAARKLFLEICHQRGATKRSLVIKATRLYRIAIILNDHPGLKRVTDAHTRQIIPPRDFRLTAEWIWFLNGGPERKSMPFADELDGYCRWAHDERGFTIATINQSRWHMTGFLFWYSVRDRPLEELDATDIDDYIAYCSGTGWSRRTMNSVAKILRMFFRFATDRGWTRRDLVGTIQAPRIYADESLPSGIDWNDVRRLFATLDPTNATDVRDRAILMLMTIYGLRVSEVAALSLDDFDWDRNLLLVSRRKRRDRQAYPLSSAVRDALVDYLTHVRCSDSEGRRLFLTVLTPYRPMSTGALYERVAKRLTFLGIRVAHRGPHCLRHACAARLVSEGLTLKEIGDHLGHRSTRSTRIYAKVDLAGLRQVASFDLGDVV
jgi:integrase/recombinase XerD